MSTNVQCFNIVRVHGNKYLIQGHWDFTSCDVTLTQKMLVFMFKCVFIIPLVSSSKYYNIDITKLLSLHQVLRTTIRAQIFDHSKPLENDVRN